MESSHIDSVDTPDSSLATAEHFLVLAADQLEDTYPVLATALSEISGWLVQLQNNLERPLEPHEVEAAAVIDLEAATEFVVAQAGFEGEVETGSGLEGA